MMQVENAQSMPGALTQFLGNGEGSNGDFSNNPLMWLITLGFLGNGSFFGNRNGENGVSAMATSDTLRGLQSDVSSAAVNTANQTNALLQANCTSTADIVNAINYSARAAAQCCCDTRVEISNQGAANREAVLHQTNAIQNGFMGMQGMIDRQAAASMALNCQNTNSIQAQIAACCCETQKLLLEQNSILQRQHDDLKNTVVVQSMSNRQAILEDQLAVCRTDLSNCRQDSGLIAAMQSQTAAIIAAVQATCGHHGH